jgi:hypothetical protein
MVSGANRALVASDQARAGLGPSGFDHGYEWQDISTAPKDVPVLVTYDHDADPYHEPSDPRYLTNYAAHAESGTFVSGRGVTVAVLRDGWHEDDGWESNNPPYWMPPAWWAWLDGDSSDYVLNATHWMPLPEPATQSTGETK